MIIDEFMISLQKKYSERDITYNKEDEKLVINIDEKQIECDWNTFNQGYEEHGIKFINGFIDMLEDNFINDNPLMPEGE